MTRSSPLFSNECTHTWKKERKKERRRWQERTEYQDRFCSSTEKDIVFHHFSPSWVWWLCPLKNPCEWGRDEATRYSTRHLHEIIYLRQETLRHGIQNSAADMKVDGPIQIQAPWKKRMVIDSPFIFRHYSTSKAPLLSPSFCHTDHDVLHALDISKYFHLIW